MITGSQMLEGGAALLGKNYNGETPCTYVTVYDSSGMVSSTRLSLSEEGAVPVFCVTGSDIFYVETVGTEEAPIWLFHSPGGTTMLSALQEDGHAPIGLLPTDNGLLLATGSTLYGLDHEGTVLWSTAADEVITQLLPAANGTVLAVLQDGDSHSLYTPDNHALKYLCTLPDTVSRCSILPGFNMGYDCLLYDSQWCYGWNTGTQEAVPLFRFDDIGLSSSRLSSLVCISKTTLLGTNWRSGDLQDRLFRIEPAEKPDHSSVLTIGAVTESSGLADYMTDFRAMFPNYTIDYINYEELYGVNAALQLQLDMTTGYGPDLLLLIDIDHDAYAAQGLLENLYPWIDQDAELNREDFLPNLLDALEFGDEALYRLPQSFSVATALGLSHIWGDRSSCSFEDLYEAKTQLQDSGTIFYAMDHPALARELLFQGYSQFIDAQTGTAGFDTPEFHALLQFIQSTDHKSRKEYDAEDPYEALLNREILLYGQLLHHEQSYEALQKEHCDSFVCVGYPGTNGSAFYLNYPMGICAQSQQKELAWSFLKLLLTSGLRTTRGGWSPLTARMEETLAQSGVRKETEDTLKRLFYGIDHVVYYDQAVTQILLDELPAFLDGTRSAEAAATHIDDRVQLYLDEKR